MTQTKTYLADSVLCILPLEAIAYLEDTGAPQPHLASTAPFPLPNYNSFQVYGFSQDLGVNDFLCFTISVRPTDLHIVGRLNDEHINTATLFTPYFGNTFTTYLSHNDRYCIAE